MRDQPNFRKLKRQIRYLHRKISMILINGGPLLKLLAQKRNRRLSLSRRRRPRPTSTTFIARAKKTATAAEILLIELDATKRHILTQEEVLGTLREFGGDKHARFMLRLRLSLDCGYAAVATQGVSDNLFTVESLAGLTRGRSR
jgi:hypothetical protein